MEGLFCSSAETNYIYTNRNNQQRFSNYKIINNTEIEIEEEEVLISMAFTETPIDKVKTLQINRNQIIDLIFNSPTKYIEENIFENLCNNLELSDNNVNTILIECLNFAKLDINEICYLENEILIGEEEDHKNKKKDKLVIQYQKYLPKIVI